MIKLGGVLRDFLGTHGEIKPERTSSPVFITGCMRSGTTFLVDNLSSHPQLLKLGSELSSAWDSIGEASILTNCEKKLRSEASPMVTYQMTNYFRQFIEENKSFKRHLMRARNRFKSGTGSICCDWSNIIPMNKSTHIMNKIPFVNEVFPNSKFILIVRDIFAEVSSLKAHYNILHKTHGGVWQAPDSQGCCWSNIPQSKIKELNSNAQVFPFDFSVLPKMWVRLNYLAINDIIETGSDNHIIISYEDLVTKQEVVFRRLFDFLDLKDEYKSVENSICLAKISKINTTTTGDFLTKWKKQLTPNEIDQVRSVISDEAEKYDAIKQAIIQNQTLH